MTSLSGNPNNFIRIKEGQYSADIAEAEKRGRESAAASVAPTSSAPVDTKTAEAIAKEKAGAEAIEKIKILQKEKAAQAAAEQDPATIAQRLTAYVAAEKAKGRRIGLAQATNELAAQNR